MCVHRAALCFFAAMLWLAAQGGAQATIKIVALGTSNTLGRYVARGEDYPAKLEAALRARHHDVQVINAGKNGDMVAGTLARLNSAVPDGTQIVIVEIGVNDRRENNSPAYIQSGLNQIVDRLRARNIEVLVANYMDVSGGGIARGTYFVDFDVARMPATLKIPNDPFHHLNAAGYDVIVARMLPAVESLIKRVQQNQR